MESKSRNASRLSRLGEDQTLPGASGGGGGGLRWTPWFEPVSEARCRLLTSRTRREDSGRIFYSNLLQQQLEAIKFLYLIFTFKGIHGGWLGIQIASKDRK